MHGNFLSQGFRELGRKLARSRLRRTIRKHESERLTALTALGQAAWEGKIDLGKHAVLRDRLAGLDARAGELSQESSRLEKDKSALEAQRTSELDAFAARRKAVETKKSPVDAALREARSRKAACEQAIKQAESRAAAIAGKVAGLDRDIASLGAAAGADAQQKVTAAQTERAKLASEQVELGPKLAASRAELPGHAAEDSRLAGESQKHAAEIAVVDAEQKAAIGRIDAELARLRSELQGATQQSGAVSKDRAGTFGELGKALYDGGERPAALSQPIERVATIDRDRAQSDSAHYASLAESSTVPGAAMAKFWGVMLGVPLMLAVLGTVAYRYAHRDVSAADAPQPAAVAQVNPGECQVQDAPEKGKGVMVRSNCIRHEGTFTRGVLQNGKITYPDGRVAEGTFVGGQQLGMGTLTWRDGRRYEGMFVEGRSSGPGIFVAADGTRYRGMFEPGVKLTGIGTRKSPDGTVLVGEFVDGKPSKKMVLVRDGKAEVVAGDTGVPPKGTATLETVTQ